MYTYIYIYNTYMKICMYTHMQLCVYMYIMYIYIYICIRLYIYITCEFYIGVNDLPVFTTAHRSHPFLVDNPFPSFGYHQPIISAIAFNIKPPIHYHLSRPHPQQVWANNHQPSSGAPLKTLPQNLRWDVSQVTLRGQSIAHKLCLGGGAMRSHA